ncbi:MAG: SNF2-related protein [Chthoniobacterales bacterium]
MIPITERFLMDTGGWQAMKHAKALFQMGRVVSFNYAPPILHGVVREGDIEFRAGLKIRSYGDVENLCSCRQSTQWGTICPHSLALGLAVLQPKPEPALTGPPAIQQGPNLIVAGEISSNADLAERPRIELHVVIPPNFVNAWERAQVTLGFEVVTGTRRILASALDVREAFRCSEEDKRILDTVRRFTDGKLPGISVLSRDQFLEVLEQLAGHPGLTLGRDRAIAVQSSPLVPVLDVRQREDRGWQISATLAIESGIVLMGSKSAWAWKDPVFRPIAPGLPSAYLGVLREPIQLPFEQGLAFLQKEVPSLKNFLTVQTNQPDSAIEPGLPAVFLTIEGSLNYLSAKLQCLYGKRMVTLGVTSPAEDFVYQLDAKFRSRNLAFERECAEQLRHFGFHGPAGDGDFTLKGQSGILNFFGQRLPELERHWKVSIGSRLTNVTRQIDRITPRLKITGSGEDWFDVSYSLESANGDRFSTSEVQRLLQMGQSFTRLRDGQLAIFDPADLAEFESVLRDCRPGQPHPGTYRVGKIHAGYLNASFGSLKGATLEAHADWETWTSQQQQLVPLRAIPLGTFDAVLRTYQKEGVYWMHFLGENGLGGILADEMGLGKTLQALAFLSLARGPSLVVCPSSLLFNWRREAERFAPNLKVLTIEGPERDKLFPAISNHDLVLTSYPLLRRDVDSYRALRFGAIILDEANHIKNPDTQNAQAATALRGDLRFVLTGTPVENSVRDLWSIMNFLVPGYLGDRDEFRERYELPISRGSEPERSRLAKRLRPMMLRRLKREVARELPEKMEQVTFCELTDEQKELYSKLHAEGRKQLEMLGTERNRARARITMLTTLLRLRQACCDLRLLGQAANNPSGKMDLFLELIEEAVDGGHRVLVFSQFVAMLKLIQNELKHLGIEHCYLDGQTKDRARVVDRFQESADLPAFLISLKAGGVGLNLSAADTVFHFDPWWNPAVEDQATDRAHRIGQQRVVTSYKLITRGTVEEKILHLQQRKRDVIEAMVESEEPLMTSLSLDEISELLSGD